jgi:hypothetical protein
MVDKKEMQCGDLSGALIDHLARTYSVPTVLLAATATFSVAT